MYDIVFCSKSNNNQQAFENFKALYPNAQFLPNLETLSQAIVEFGHRCMTGMFWLITDDVVLAEDFDLNWRPPSWDRQYPHIWPTKDHKGQIISDFSGVYLIPRRYQITETELNTNILSTAKYLPAPVQTLVPYDRFVVNKQNITSMGQAIDQHRDMCSTEMFWLITDDVVLAEDFDLNWRPPSWDRQYPHIWPARSVNNLMVSEFAGAYLIPKSYDSSLVNSLSNLPESFKIIEGFTCSLKNYELIATQWSRCTVADHVIDASNLIDACLKSHDIASTEMYWLLSGDLEILKDFDLSWRPPPWDRIYVHRWNTIDVNGNYSYDQDGLYLVLGSYVPDQSEISLEFIKEIKQIDAPGTIQRPYDIFFISYNEINADENYERLKSRFPDAKRVHGVKGIHNAHLRCAQQSETSMFWTVDADTIVDPSFDFDYRPPTYDRKYLHLWHSRNPVNGLSYGWGAIKLWPTRLVREFRSNWLDFTTTVGNIKIISDVVATTKYNCDAISTWRSGFREAVKLCHNIANGDQVESLERLVVWLSVENAVDWAQESTQGARSGVDFYLKCQQASDIESLKNINDFDWLTDRFNNHKAYQPLLSRSELLSALRN